MFKSVCGNVCHAMPCAVCINHVVHVQIRDRDQTQTDLRTD